MYDDNQQAYNLWFSHESVQSVNTFGGSGASGPRSEAKSNFSSCMLGLSYEEMTAISSTSLSNANLSQIIYELNETYYKKMTTGDYTYYADANLVAAANPDRIKYGYESMVEGWNNLTNLTTYLGHDLNVNKILYNESMFSQYDNVTLVEMYLNQVANLSSA